MKKSLLALAVLGAFAGAASAQSSVTLYGRVDLSVNKGVGTANKGISNGSGSRFGVRGVEDLGGGLQALFQIEHRFDADTGASQNFNITPAGSTTANANRFWGARSIVGLKGGFGQVLLGREYTTAFLMSQLAADPWGWDTVVSGTPGTGLNQVITGGGIARVRNDSAVTYNLSVGGFAFGAQVAEASDAINGFQKKPFNFAATYKAGPFSVGLGYEKTGQVAAASAKWLTVNAAFDLGMVKLGGLYGTGNTAANADNKSLLITAVAPMGQGEVRASYGKTTSDGAGALPEVSLAKGFALGYHYALSKRTTVYVDYARNTAVTTEKTGYDFGIKHNF
ncbi:MAG: porin [Burkholderiaceae bacterium]|nr:porin [Burkholderiaceae bacterium]